LLLLLWVLNLLAASVLFMVVAPMGRNALDCLYYAIGREEKQGKNIV